VRYRTIGNDATGLVEVSVIGMGCLALENRPGHLERAEATMRAALDAGITLFDTANSYGNAAHGAAAFGVNEALVGELLGRLGVAGKVFVATKTGHTRTPEGGYDLDGSAVYLRKSVDGSLRRLGVEQIDLYQHHRPDPRVDYAESMGALREVFDAGKARMIGISNANPAQILVAREILGDALVAVQNEYSPAFRTSEPEVELCERLGLSFLAFSPLGGMGAASRLGQAHQAFGTVAADLGVSPQRVCLAWLRARSPVMILIPGASRPESIADSALAAELELPAEYLQQLP
jgi:aryl-alcohol dehydrogenase-like predicted oxidoreductase